ncbi:MAG TPA: hypothetical protein VFW34_08030 [Candidatus Rubrimentiphilum sp.]|nr:hypothetical protein [Candidatus Rubrimentiphilum sp.]
MFTLADSAQLLTEPEPSPEQRARIAESCRFYFGVWLAFTILWAGIGLRDLLRSQGDDKILAYIYLGTAFGMAFLARKYYQKAVARSWCFL